MFNILNLELHKLQLSNLRLLQKMLSSSKFHGAMILLTSRASWLILQTEFHMRKLFNSVIAEYHSDCVSLLELHEIATLIDLGVSKLIFKVL